MSQPFLRRGRARLPLRVIRQSKVTTRARPRVLAITLVSVAVWLSMPDTARSWTAAPQPGSSESNGRDGDVRLSVLGLEVNVRRPSSGQILAAPAIPQPPQLAPPQSFDDQLATISQRFPGFGGMFVDEATDTLFLYMTGSKHRPERAGSALAAAQAVRELSPLIDQSKIEVLEARYDFQQLKRWKDRMGALFEVGGVVSLDIEESKNRLEVGLSGDQPRLAVQRRLTELGIPREAVLFERRLPIKPENDLQDFHRPLIAGLRISRPLGQNRNSVCSIGFVAWSARHRKWGFVTASHCTAIKGGVEGTEFYQPFEPSRSDPLSGAFNGAGKEVDDPFYFNCYWIYRCRYSDTSFVVFSDATQNLYGQWYELGGMARPPGDACCTTKYDGQRLRIITEGIAAEGNGIAKIGGTSGSTSGTVTDTCDDSLMEGGVILLCQFTANYGARGGDSGGAVFWQKGTDAAILGTHVGRSGSDAVFSPISNVQRDNTELGFLWNCADFRC